MSFLQMNGKSFGAILDHYKGAGPGFDLLRFGLAVTILFSHSSGLAGNGHFLSGLMAWLFHLQPAPEIVAVAQAGGAVNELNFNIVGPARPYTLSHVPMFFALSGFLVAGSAFRTVNVFRFLALRGLRIFPALIVEVLLSAFVIGTVFTDLPLSEYFTSPDFYRYFGNIFGWVTMKLPGVFSHNISSNVNANLWTLPAEFDCYFIAAILISTRLIFNRRVYSALFVIATVILIYVNTDLGINIYTGLLHEVNPAYYFFVGFLFYLWRDKIPYDYRIMMVCSISCYALMMLENIDFIYPILLTYITIFIGLTRLPEIKFLKTGDYSYGIYLYGFPLTQALIALFPIFRANVLFLGLSACVITLGFAWLSWHIVEKRVLKWKRYLSPRSAAITAILQADPVPVERDAVFGSKAAQAT